MCAGVLLIDLSGDLFTAESLFGQFVDRWKLLRRNSGQIDYTW